MVNSPDALAIDPITINAVMTTALHQLRAVGLDFLETAAVRFVYEVELPASPDAVFAAISADPSTWTWFPGLTSSPAGPVPRCNGPSRSNRNPSSPS